MGILSPKKTKVYKRILFILIALILMELIVISYHSSKSLSVFHGAAQNDINLLDAYKEKDEEKVVKYFKTWKEESLKLTKTAYKDSLEESLYNIYRVIFKPYYLEPLYKEGLRLGGYELDLIDVINRTPYVVTQYKLDFIFRDLDAIKDQDLFDYFVMNRFKRKEIHTLTDFYPKVDLNEGKVLHLTKQYEDDLNQFLGTNEHPFGKGSIMAPANPKGETLERYDFIRNYIPILYGHWGGYWHLATHPEIGYIIMDTDLKHAIVQYRLGYEFGFAEVKKAAGVWVRIRAILNGIE